MNPQYALLGILAREPNYGYELKKLYDRLFGREKSILPGQIYSTLARLKRDKKIREVVTNKESGGPERIQYAITKEGNTILREWLATPEEPSATLQVTLYMKVVLAILTNGSAAPFLDAQRHMHIEKMRDLVKRRRVVSIGEKLLIDHALFHIEADLRWIDLTGSRLEKLKEELCR